MLFILLFLAVIFLAYSNGANDNFKGVATLFGSGTASYKKAILWASITTFAGSITALFFASSLVKNFSGKGLVPDSLINSPEFAISIVLGSALTVFIATKIAMPISTTHSLVGALVGSGLIAVGLEFNFSKLFSTFLIPLIVSPLISALLSLLLYHVISKLKAFFSITKTTCICVGSEFIPINNLNNKSKAQALSLNSSVNSVSMADNSVCIERYQGKFLGISAQEILDFGHFLSAGVVSFARGLNDTPKMLGLLLVINALNINLGLLVIAFAMIIGGLINAKKVAETMSKKITPMSSGQGFNANLITGILVTSASSFGLPVSTTHVSVGSIFGIGLLSKKANYSVIKNILLSWLLTLPIAALCSSIIYYVFKMIN